MRHPAFKLGAAAIALTSMLAGPPIAVAQTVAASAAAGYGPTAQSMRFDLNGGGSQSQSLSLGKGKSAIIDLPADARDVLVTNPKVADAVLRTPRRIYILGVDSGQTDAVFFDGMGRRILTLDIRVDQDGRAAAETIARVVPNSRIHIESVNNSLILTGTVDNAADSNAAQRIAEQFTSKPEQVINMLSIAGQEQVMLKVRVVEVQRTAIKQLGVNIDALIGKLGDTQFSFIQNASFGVNGAPSGGSAGGITHVEKDGEHANAAFRAFERAGLVRTLAEPNLTAVSGEAAKFLAGGEFPVPVGQDTEGRITVEFKPFGVGLGFTPVVLSDGRISLKISTEVSELTTEGAFGVQAGTATLVIPALNVRRAQTVVELPSGGSMMIAGLLQSKSKQAVDSLPGVGDVPVLGALFRSRDFQNGDTELVVIVTPYLVKPTSPSNMQTPADGLLLANDGQAILLGKLNKSVKGGPAATQGQALQGPYGYVIE
jgi:pilus assembly protein CpaC